jgi:hypothetical protein
VQQLHQPHGSRQRNGIHCGIRIHDDLKVPFTLETGADSTLRIAENSHANARRSFLPDESGRVKRRQSKRGTFWTIFLQFDLEKATLSPAATRGL